MSFKRLLLLDILAQLGEQKCFWGVWEMTEMRWLTGHWPLLMCDRTARSFGGLRMTAPHHCHSSFFIVIPSAARNLVFLAITRRHYILNKSFLFEY